VHELANGALGQTHGFGHLGAAAALNRGPDQRIVLAGRQLRYLGEGVDGEHPPFGNLLGGLGGRGGVIEFGRSWPGRGLTPGEIAQDLMQPAANMANFGSRLKGRQGGQECLLNEIIRPLRTDLLGVGMERQPVALGDEFKRTLVPQPGQRGKPFIRLRSEQQV
jgi:hypothetical protein